MLGLIRRVEVDYNNTELGRKGARAGHNKSLHIVTLLFI